MCVYTYKYIQIHTNTYKYIRVYVYIYIHMYGYLSGSCSIVCPVLLADGSSPLISAERSSASGAATWTRARAVYGSS